jgi:hypothetical protein
VYCCRFWWELEPEGLFQELKLKARDQRKQYQEVVGVTVQKNLSHMELRICYGVPFQL